MKKTTQELLDTMQNYRSYEDYLKNNLTDISRQTMPIDRALTAVLTEKKLVKAEIIKTSGIEPHYGYQIFSGAKKPTRDKILMLLIAMKLTVDEIQQILKITGYEPLYSKINRDNAILFGITKRYTVIDINDLLFDLHYDVFI